MAHFAKLGPGNIVQQVVVVDNSIATDEAAGVEFLQNLYKDRNVVWKQTSFNTIGNTHKLGGTPFRKNYAGIGFKYDATRDAFYEPKPYQSWSLNETSCLWEPPITLPDDGNKYQWNEENYQSDNSTGWVQIV